MSEVNKFGFYCCAIYRKAHLLSVALSVLLLASAAQAHAPSTNQAPKALPRTAPAFTIAATDGKAHSLADYRGRSSVLFFFCGCRWCTQTAQSWSRLQRGGTLEHIGSGQARNSAPDAVSKTSPKPSGAPPTLIVYLGDKNDVQKFARETQLDLKQTVLLPDPDEKVSSLYQADPCPRVFVVDGQGSMRYTNNEMGADSYKIPAPLITARTVDALRAVAAKPATPPATKKPTTTAKPASGKPAAKPASKPAAPKK